MEEEKSHEKMKMKMKMKMNSFIPHEEEEDEEEEEASTQQSPERISAVEFSAVINKEEEEDSDDNSGSEFEFPSLINDPLIQIRKPIYPVFGRPFNSSSSTPVPPEPDLQLRLPLRKLLIQERNSSVGSTSSTSSSTVDLEGVPPESYCVWSPSSAPQSPARCRKSGSTGSLIKWKKISDLVLGRSQSDGKEKFVYLSVKEKEKEKRKKGGKNTTEVDTVTAHRILYGGNGVANGVTAGRKSFLPYRQDLVGIFASVNGISRNHHPF